MTHPHDRHASNTLREYFEGVLADVQIPQFGQPSIAWSLGKVAAAKEKHEKHSGSVLDCAVRAEGFGELKMIVSSPRGFVRSIGAQTAGAMSPAALQRTIRRTRASSPRGSSCVC